jgi:hypothetical protein
MAMDLKTWRQKKQAGERFTLPSGLVVALRKASLLDLAEQGQIPAPLTGAVDALLSERRTLTVQTAREFLVVVNVVVKATLIDPPIAEEPGDGVLGVAELSVADRLAIYDWATEETAALRPFRAEDAEPG